MRARLWGAALGCMTLVVGCDEPADLQARSAFNVDNGCPVPEILGRSTRLPVAVATDGITVEVDHVYVIPPGVNLAMFQGKLHLMDVPTAPAGERPST